jgi:ribosomal protein L20A (L18A)
VSNAPIAPGIVKWPALVGGAARLPNVSTWKIQGSFYARRGYWQVFTKECEAETDAAAREWVLSEIGSNHHVKRHEIRIVQLSTAGTA